ncbi:MAG: EAL domain-containing protein [Pseudomonadota bacterium]
MFDREELLNHWFIEKLGVTRYSWDFFLSSLLLSIGTVTGLLFIIWSAFGQIQSYKTTQQELLTNSVNAVAMEIANQVEARSRIVTAVANDLRQTLELIIAQPDEERRIARVERQLKAYFPEMYAFTLVDENGALTPDDPSERIGAYCIDEIKLFAKGDSTLSHTQNGLRSYIPFLHSQPNAYHFDIMGLWQGIDQQNRIMFISFRGELLAKLIRTHQLPGHLIFLVRADQPDLIEVGANGTRDQLTRQSRVNEDDKNEPYIQIDAPGTRWKVIGFLQPNLLPQYTQITSKRFSTNFFILFCFWLVSILVLFRLHKHKKSAFQKLQGLNDNLEAIVMQRTQELTKLSKAVAQSPVEVLISSVDGTVEYVNPMFTKLSGFSEEEVLGINIRKLESFKVNAELMQDIWEHVTAGETWQGELLSHHKHGKEYWIRLSVSPVRNSQRQISHFIGIGEDITQKRAQEEKIRYQAQYDDLTGLPNRILARDRLEQAIRLVGRTYDKVALIFVDLDDFKKVNDTLGHDTGDILIFEAAQRLKSAIRESDTVARLGGDEFLIIIQQIKNLNSVESIAQNIIDKFSHPFLLAESEFIVTASLGITLFPDDGTTAKELMRGADLAMYQSKLEGKNTHYFFSPSMDEATREYSILEQQLHNALERGEFHVVFQPIVRLHDAFPVGCEALIRWNNPVLGMVEPERFIPVAEQTGLIISIGEYVLREACREMAFWNSNNELQLFVSVNLSPRQFWYSSLNEMVAGILQETGLAAEFLELELTEGMIIRDHRDTEQIMQKLNTQGIKIAMDDFGTGYSSLYQLKSFPFDKLKIDRSFVQDLETDSDDDAVVRAAVALAHGLELEIVAEGIESESQRHILTNENCQYGQGYLFSKPVNAEMLSGYLQKCINQ